MRHFAYLGDVDRDRLFEVAPAEVTPNSPRTTIALALGATLYAPGTRRDLPMDAHRVGAAGATSMVWCLEDAIEHDVVDLAEANVVAALQRIHVAPAAERARLPLLFVRVRDAGQVRRLARAAGPALGVLTGFSLPKADSERAPSMLAAVREASVHLGRRLYSMPILESAAIAYFEARKAELVRLAGIFSEYGDDVLCVRVGGTDLSGLFGLRRDRDTTIWDVAVVRDALADIINQFARNGDHVVSGAVWEHIPAPRLLKPLLRETPFHEQDAAALRRQLIGDDVDGLMREISLDKTNGMYGKTIIHPSHISVVNSLLTVHREEYDDARMIVDARERGGVLASVHGRMNEIGPHARWADQVLARAGAYGVLAENSALVELLAIGQRVAAETFESPTAAAHRIRVVS